MGGEFNKILKIKAVALFSGGLDSMLAVKLIQEQGIDVLGVAFETPFFSSEKPVKAAKTMELPLLVINITEEYLPMLKSPRYGYGRNMNPCIDCHAMMLRIAGKKMEETGADFLITGEVLGQRPMSQNKQSLHIVAKNSGYNGFVLRPLSARLLPSTIPETDGKVDRGKLLNIQGRGRKQQIEMAARYGITSYANPAGGCLLTDPMFSRRLRDLFEHRKDFEVRDIELLKIGRHFRIDDETKIVVGRNSRDNAMIRRFSREGDIVIEIKHFPGPVALVPYGCNDETLDRAAAVCASYSDAPENKDAQAACRIGTTVKEISIMPTRREEIAKRII